MFCVFCVVSLYVIGFKFYHASEGTVCFFCSLLFGLLFILFGGIGLRTVCMIEDDFVSFPIIGCTICVLFRFQIGVPFTHHVTQRLRWTYPSQQFVQHLLKVRLCSSICSGR